MGSDLIDPSSLSARLGGRALASAGFFPVWLLIVALFVVAAFVAPNTISDTSFSQIWPFASVLAIAALGEMLVVMTGGIDLSVPSVMTMVGTVLLGVGAGESDRLGGAVVVALALSAAIGLVNGVLIGYLRLNPLIVTLAVGQIGLGLTAEYRSDIANESEVPPSLAEWASDRLLGVTTLLWVGAAITLAVAILLNRARVGRRFQAVGANSRAAWIAGIDVRRYTATAYVAAGLLYGAAGILLAGFIRTPTLIVGAPYLLGPIAAVVIAGASLSGGLASAISTWGAAFALTFLETMLRVMGLPSALQFVVFGAAIAAGMVISGDSIVGLAVRATAPRRPATVSGRDR
jgi:ribose/xylose/arabinose/galactoside ABC-type transport system permease subunit